MLTIVRVSFQVCMHYLHAVFSTSGIDSILEQYLLTVLGSVEGMAAVQAQAIVHVKVVEPPRFFADDSALGFSPIDMGFVLDAIFQFLDLAKDNGALPMDIDLKIFDRVLKEDEKMHYAAWKQPKCDQKDYSLDGRHVVNTHPLVMAALFTLEDADMQSTEIDTKNLLQALAEGFIDGMKTTSMSDSLSSCEGKYSASVISLAASNPAEASFGAFK